MNCLGTLLRAGLAFAFFWLAPVATGLAGPADGAGARLSDQAALRQALPEADRFGPLEGDPPAIAGYRGQDLIGYVFSSRQIVQSTGYSAKPLDLLVGMSLEGIIAGVIIAEHHEPVLVIGVGEDDMDRFIAQYRGLDIRQPFRVTRWQGEPGLSVDAISGATISSQVMNDAVLRSARAVAASRGLLGAQEHSLDFASFSTADWPALLAEGSLRRLTVAIGEAEDALRRRGGRLFAEGVPVPDPGAPFFELFAALATPARVGRNLLGERDYNAIMAELEAGDQIVLVAGRGLWSFKGRDYRRSGRFDRLQLIQGNRAISFRADDHRPFEGLKAEAAPELREIAVFKVRKAEGFDPADPWRLRFLVSGQPVEGPRGFALFDLPYDLPARYIKTAAAPEGAAEEMPLWQRNWRDRQWSIGTLLAGLLVLSSILVFQDAVAKRKKLYQALRIGFLLFTLVWIGWIAGAQLSVINVLTFANALLEEFRWDFFLLEPLIFILWGYVAVALLFWGRGVFCGWLCPFGALQELVGRLGRLARLPQWRLPFGLHERLWPIKYIAFLALAALFLHDPELAIMGAEVEPFKTAIVLKFDRAWPYLLYVGVLLVASLFVTRAYCRYLCPLGGALALPARLRMFEWLRRRWQCGKPCQNCAVSCPVQAIHPEGRINPNECIHCLNCQVNYYDDSLCPVLVERGRRRERARGPGRGPGPGTTADPA